MAFLLFDGSNKKLTFHSFNHHQRPKAKAPEKNLPLGYKLSR